jgi:hypothetical protein
MFGMRSRSAPNRLYWNTRFFSFQFVQVLTNLWHRHTYSLSRYRAKLRPIKDRDSPQVVLWVYFAFFIKFMRGIAQCN